MRGGRAALATAIAGALLGTGVGPSARAAPSDAGDAAGDGAAAAPLVLLVQADATDASAGGPGPGAGAGDPPAGAGLRLRRLRVGDDVRAGAWRARVVLEAQPASQPYGPLDGGRLPGIGPVRLTDAFLAYAPGAAFEIDAGAQRVPFSLSRQVDEVDLRLPERPAIVARATPDFRAGLALRGDLGLLQYAAAVMSGAAALDRSVSRDGALVAMRLAAEPIGPMGVAPWRRGALHPGDPWNAWWRFSAGASILYGTLGGQRTMGLGGDGQLQWRRFTATAEYLFLSDGGGDRQGAAVEPGIFLVRDRLELTLRAAWSRVALQDTLAAGAGLTLSLGDGRVRAQAAVERRRAVSDDPGAPAALDWAVVRATLAL
jgi:hypothetical protein